LFMSKWFSLALVSLFSASVNANDVYIGAVGSYANGDKALEVDGYSLSNRTGGLGIELGGQLLDGYIDASGSAQYAVSSDTSAAFLGASVSGPADLTTLRYDIRLYALPKSIVTPYLSLARMTYDGNVDFSGTRNGSVVTGKADVDFNRTTTGLGLRYTHNDSLEVSAEFGTSSWRIRSVANGTLGMITATTTLDTKHDDDYLKLGFTYDLGDSLSVHGSLSQYELTGDNSTQSLETSAGLRYAF